MTKKPRDAMVALVTATLLVWVAASSGTAAPAPGEPWTRKELGENAQPEPAGRSVAAYDAKGEQVVLFIPHSGTWVWNGRTWNSSPLGAAPEGSDYPAMAYDAANEEIVLFIAPDVDRPGETYTWSGTTWMKESPDTSPPGHNRASMAFDEARGEIVLLEGVDVDPSRVNGTWLWNGENWKKGADPIGPEPARIDSAMAFDRTLGKVVLFGGSETSVEDSGQRHTFGRTQNSLCDTWAWDGSAWAPVPTDKAPPPRSWHAMVADTGLNVPTPEEPTPFKGLVMFGGLHLGGSPIPPGQGGSGVSYLNDTWVWNGRSWNPGPSVGPSPRFGHGMAYDPDRDRPETVLFGGYGGLGANGTGATNDTWTLGSGPETNPYSQPEISIHDASVYEGEEGDTRMMSFGVTASGLYCTTEEVTVAYSTQDDSATHPDDYEQTTGTLTFANGQSAATVQVPVKGDSHKEQNEQFFVNLGSPDGATIGQGRATGTIIDISEEPIVDPGLIEVPEVEIPAVEAPDTPHLPRLPEVSPPSGGGGSEGSGPSPSNSGTLGPGGGGPGVGGGGPASQALSTFANPAGSGSPAAIPVASPPLPSPHVSSTQSAQAAGILLSQPPPFALAPQQVPWTAGAQGQMSAALGSASSEPDDPQPQPAFEMTAISPDQPQGSVFWLGLLALLTVMIARPARRSVWHCGSDGASIEQYDPKPSPAWAGAR